MYTPSHLPRTQPKKPNTKPWPPNKQKALMSFFNLGNKAADRVLAKYSIFPRAQLGSLSPKTVLQLTAELSTMHIENDARKAVVENIKRLRDMGSYRGRRHAMGLPLRGQRTQNQISSSVKLNKVERFRIA